MTTARAPRLDTAAAAMQKMRPPYILLLGCLVLASSDAFAPVTLLKHSILPRVSRRESSCGLRMMSDLGDMTMEMLRRLMNPKNLGELSPQDRTQLKNLCAEVSAKLDGPSAAPKAESQVEKKPALRSESPAAVAKPFVVGSPKADKAAIAENDKFFGIDDTPLDESGEPIKPGRKNPVPRPVLKNLKEDPTAGTRRFSKYLAEERPTIQANDLATDESLVDNNQWLEEYQRVFGAPPDNRPLTDIDDLNAARNVATNDVIDDSFAEVRRVQANADKFASSDDYYKALMEAMNKWKAERVGNNQAIGSASSDRYIDQLANMAPTAANRQKFGEKKKFTLDCMLNPVEAQDEEGNPVTILQFTQVDEKGCCGLAGIQRGEALTMLNGQQVNSYADLNKVIGDIHAKNLAVVEGVVQGAHGVRTVKLAGI